MKQLLSGVAVVAVLAMTAPGWSQTQNNPPQAGSPPAPPPLTQSAQPNGTAPQAQAPAQQQNQTGQAEQRNAQPRNQQQNAERRGTRENAGPREEQQAGEQRTGRGETAMRRHHHYVGRGMAYRMRGRVEHWRMAESWRMHHWRHLHAWRHHHRYAYGWGTPYGYRYWSPSRRYGWYHRHWPNDFMANRLNGQELATMGSTTYTTQYYGASTPPMAYAPSAGYEAAPMAGSVLWYPPGTNPPSPPGFPPAFYGTWWW